MTDLEERKQRLREALGYSEHSESDSTPIGERDTVQELMLRFYKQAMRETSDAPEQLSAFVGRIILHIGEVWLGVTIADFFLRVLPEIIKTVSTMS